MSGRVPLPDVERLQEELHALVIKKCAGGHIDEFTLARLEAKVEKIKKADEANYFFYKGELGKLRDDEETAMGFYEMSLKVSKDAISYRNYAIACRWFGHNEKARELFVKALELNKNDQDTFTWGQLIGLDIEMKNYGEAEKENKEALDAFPGDPLFISYAETLKSISSMAKLRDIHKGMANEEEIGTDAEYDAGVMEEYEKMTPLRRKANTFLDSE